jgi:hypothetical protein
MSTFSRYALAGILGALIATGLFDGPLSLVSAGPVFQPAAVRGDLTVVDRTAKGDRLATRPDAGTTIIQRNDTPSGTRPRNDTPSTPTIGARETLDPRLAPASLQDCEPVASPYADPKLGKFVGRCFV